ncbi:MAG: ATP-binding cassette domain-containing protein [Thermoplasmata archaeon]|nr:ATP-binding cassette domain-containing protein [Thermoplasmata archaeon]
MDEPNNCAISVDKLTKVYDGFLAVDHISFCVREGEIFGFLGPNGAGKTTTVRMLVGLTKITEGNARICGYDVVKDYKRVRQVFGVVPDVSNLYFELTSYQNLLFSARMYGLPRDLADRRARELLRFFGFGKMKDRKFKALSRGLRRRLAIAAALIHEPRVLFLDEPTSGLDVVSRRILWSKLKELNRAGITIFLTTHNVYEAFHIADRIAVINKGKIVTIGSPRDLSKKFGFQEVIEVGFQPRNPKKEEIMRSVKGVLAVRAKGGHLEIITSDSLAALEGLARFARERGLIPSMLMLRGADAEELFLRIISEAK